MTKIYDFPYPIYDLTKHLIASYDRYGCHSCPKYNLCRKGFIGSWEVLLMVFISNNEKVMKILAFRPFQFKEQEKTNSGYKHKQTSFVWCMQLDVSYAITYIFRSDSSEFRFWMALQNTIDWDQNQSDLSNLTLNMRRVTGSPWIADFRCWTWPEVAILGADQKERGLWGRECLSGYYTWMGVAQACHPIVILG